jgi:hypothetical protein
MPQLPALPVPACVHHFLPFLQVRPTQFGVMDATTLFVAFEGRATSHTPLFKGIDLFRFNDSATKITEVEGERRRLAGCGW